MLLAYKHSFLFSTSLPSLFLSSTLPFNLPDVMSPSPLPSFVELMESLGLARDSKLPVSRPVSRSQSRASSRSRSHSRSASPPPSILSKSPRAESPTIIVSQYDAPPNESSSNQFKRRASSGNIKAARFSPYASNTRRGSMSALGESHQRDGEHHRDKAPQSSSSRRSSGSSQSSSSADSIPPVPPLPVRRARGASQDRLRLAAASCTPISSFARRRSPQASPTSPSFSANRQRSTNTALPSPVMIPTLPPMLAESLASFSFPASSDRNRTERRSPSKSPRSTPMDVDQENRAFVKHHQAGLRISSFHRQIAPVA